MAVRDGFRAQSPLGTATPPTAWRAQWPLGATSAPAAFLAQSPLGATEEVISLALLEVFPPPTAKLSLTVCRGLSLQLAMPSMAACLAAQMAQTLHFPAAQASLTRAYSWGRVTLAVRASAPRDVLRLSACVYPSLHLTLPPIDTAHLNLVWDSSTYRPTLAPHVRNLRWQTAGRAATTRCSSFAAPARCMKAIDLPVHDGVRRHAWRCQPWGRSPLMQRRTEARWQDAERANRTSCLPLRATVTMTTMRDLPWQEADPLRRTNCLSQRQSMRLERRVTAVFTEADPLRRSACMEQRGSLTLVLHPTLRWQEAMRPPKGISPFVPGQPGTPPPGSTLPIQIIVPVLEIYSTMNNTRLYFDESGDEITATEFSIGIDVDSWCWHFSATCPAFEAPRLMTADPVVLALEANGELWRFWLENVSRERRFGSDRLRISGRGLAAMLDAPYAASRAYDNAAGGLLAQQLAADALTINGVSNGWDLDWQLADWFVPSGVWGHQGAPMSAVSRVAQAAGGYVHGHRNQKRLLVRARYPHAPWLWSGLDPDVTLPESAVIQESTEREDRPFYDRVFIAGETAGGILADVRRAGKAGDALAPMEIDRLITAEAAARARGVSILAETGRGRTITLSIQLLPGTGVIDPGRYIRYGAGSSACFGLSRAVEVSYTNGVLRQSVTMEVRE